MSPRRWIVALMVGTLGDSWADDLAADTPGKWLALMPGPGATDRLTDVTVRVGRHPRAAGDDPDLDRASVLVEEPRGTPRFLIRGLNGIRRGKALRLAVEYRLTVDCPLTVHHPMATTPWLLTLRILAAEGDHQDHQAVAMVRHGARSATLGLFPWWPDRTGLRDPTVEWVGDLDGDGSVDMLIDLTDGEKGEACPTLWMGSTDPLAPLATPRGGILPTRLLRQEPPRGYQSTRRFMKGAFLPLSSSPCNLHLSRHPWNPWIPPEKVSKSALWTWIEKLRKPGSLPRKRPDLHFARPWN